MTLPLELIVTYLSYCTDKIKVDYIRSCRKNIRYRHFFMIREMSGKVNTKLIYDDPDKLKNINRINKVKFNELHNNPAMSIREIELFGFMEKMPFEYFSIRKNETQFGMRRLPVFLSARFPYGIRSVFVNGDNNLSNLKLLPTTVKQMTYYGQYIINFINCLILPIETLILINTDRHLTQCIIPKPATFDSKNLKRLKLHKILFDHQSPVLECLSVTNNDTLKYDKIPSTLKSLSCWSIEDLFQNDDTSHTKLESLNVSVHLNYSLTLTKLSYQVAYLTFDGNSSFETIKILSLPITCINQIEVHHLRKLKKLTLLLSINNDYNRYQLIDKCIPIVNDLISYVPCIIFYNSVEGNVFKNVPVFHESMILKWYHGVLRMKHVVVEAIGEINIVIDDSIIDLTLHIFHDYNEVSGQIRLPNSLKSLTLINNHNIVLTNIPKRLVKLDYSQGTEYDILAKYLVV